MPANDRVDELPFYEHPALNLETEPDEERRHPVEVRDRDADVVEASNTRHGILLCLSVRSGSRYCR